MAHRIPDAAVAILRIWSCKHVTSMGSRRAPASAHFYTLPKLNAGVFHTWPMRIRRSIETFSQETTIFRKNTHSTIGWVRLMLNRTARCILTMSELAVDNSVMSMTPIGKRRDAINAYMYI